jgi:hypothetical protein
MRKQIKKVRKYHKSPLAAIKVLDIPKEDLTDQIDLGMIGDVDNL